MEGHPNQQHIERAVEEGFDDAVHMLEELVAIDSLLNNETGAVDYMERKFRELGLAKVDRFPVRLEDIKHLPGFSPVDWDYDKKECVVGVHIPATTKGKSLIFNGHLDVVPTGPSEMWTTAPFKPTIRDGRLYGRGAGDMKAGVVAYYAALKAIYSLGFAPAAEVQLQAVIEEECTGNGALACCAKGYNKADAVIVPEPFAATIITAQLGVMWLKIKVRGKPAHVLDTSAGVNGIEAAHHLYSGLRELEEKWNSDEERKGCPAYDSFKHPINFNLGVIQGGEWASSVPTDCIFEVRIGFFPGKKLEDIRKEVEEKVAETAKARNILYTLEWRGFQAEGCIMDEKNAMMQLLGDVHKRVTKQEPVYTPVTCTTDARFFELYYNTPATCYGPEAKSIHGIDESVSLESMRQVTKALAVFIAEWCGLERKQ